MATKRRSSELLWPTKIFCGHRKLAKPSHHMALDKTLRSEDQSCMLRASHKVM